VARASVVRAEPAGSRIPSGPRISTEALGGLITAIAFLLTAIGVLMIYSASTTWGAQKFDDPAYFLKRQLLGAGLGIAAFLVCARLPHDFWKRHCRGLLLFSAFLLVLVLVAGTTWNGAKRWLRFAGMGCQPSEIAKLAVIVHAAAFLALRGDLIREFKRGFLPALAPVVLLAGLTLVEPDFGTALFLSALGVLVLTVGGLRLKHLTLCGAALLPLVTFAMGSKFDYIRHRLAFFEGGEPGYQVRQSFIALGSGGLTGRGIGAGTGKLFFLPEVAGDFIVPAIGEETGFIGILVVFGLFAGFAWCGFRLALRVLERDRFGFFLTVGITAWIVLQAVVNLAVVSGSVPTKGIALPFISYGSTSLVMGLAASGILVSIARRAGREEPGGAA